MRYSTNPSQILDLIQTADIGDVVVFSVNLIAWLKLLRLSEGRSFFVPVSHERRATVTVAVHYPNNTNIPATI